MSLSIAIALLVAVAAAILIWRREIERKLGREWRLSIPAREVVGKLTLRVRVTGMKAATLRVKLALWLIAFAGRLGGCTVTVNASWPAPKRG